MHISVVLLGITVVSREALLGMGNINSTIGGTLKAAEDTASSGGGLASNIEEGAEGALVFIDLVDVVSLLSDLGLHNGSINLFISLVDIIESNLLEKTTGDKKSGAVGSSVVLKSDLESVTGELETGGRGKNAVTVDETVNNLADDLLVGETDDKTVLGRLVLVLGLAAKTLSLTVVGLSGATTTELDLEPGEIRLVLLDLDKRLEDKTIINREG